jgi:hypothetical protein
VSTEKQRASVTGKLARPLGEEDAETLMAHLDDVATKDFVRTEIATVRTEMQVEFADVRTEMRTGLADVRTEMGTGLADVRTEMRTGLADVRTEMRTGLADVRTEMRTGLADVRTEIADVRAEMRTGFMEVRATTSIEMERGFRRMLQWLVGTMTGSVTVVSGIAAVVITVLR